MPDLSSLDHALQSLEQDLTRPGVGIAAQSGIPFAILRYAPQEEFAVRRKLRLLGHQLRSSDKQPAFLSLARFVWRSIQETDGLDYLRQVEKYRDGIARVQKDLRSRLEPGQSFSLSSQIQQAVSALPFSPDIVFLVRTGGLSPWIYRSSSLLHELQLSGYQTPTILCYPGSATAGTDLKFYDLPEAEALGTYNYRVKIYGTL